MTMETDKTLRELVSEIRTDLVEICKDVSDVKSALIGDKYREGLIDRIDKHSEQIEKLKKFKWIMVGAVVAINALMIIIVKLL